MTADLKISAYNSRTTLAYQTKIRWLSLLLWLIINNSPYSIFSLQVFMHHAFILVRELIFNLKGRIIQNRIKNMNVDLLSASTLSSPKADRNSCFYFKTLIAEFLPFFFQNYSRNSYRTNFSQYKNPQTFPLVKTFTNVLYAGRLATHSKWIKWCK